MTQSDSPDFEFDVSNLEVEGHGPSAREHAEGSKGDLGGGEVDADAQVVGEESVAASGPEAQAEMDPDVAAEFAAAAAFDIDALPDAFSSEKAIAEGVSLTGEAVPIAEPAATTLGRSRPGKSLGSENLGADIFAELEGDEESVSFDDVLDDLLDAVDDFEIGGFDEGAAVAGEGAGAADDIFRLDDPDDSLSARSGVRPMRAMELPEIDDVFEEKERAPQKVRAPQEGPRSASAASLGREGAGRPVGAKAPAPRPTISGDFVIPADDEAPVKAEALPQEVLESPVPIEEPVIELLEEEEQSQDSVAETFDAEVAVLPPDELEEVSPIRSPARGSERVLFDAAEVEAAAREEEPNVEPEATMPGLSVLEEEDEEGALLASVESLFQEEAVEEAAPGLSVLEVEEEEEVEVAAVAAPSLSIIDDEEEEALVASVESLFQEEAVEEAAPGLSVLEVEEEEEVEVAAVAAPSLGIIDDEEEDALVASAESLFQEEAVEEAAPSLSVLEVADEEEEEVEAVAAPSLGIIDDDDEELVVLENPLAGLGGLVVDDSEEEGVEAVAANAPESPKAPTAEELLLRAGSLLNGGKSPAVAASSLLDEEEIDDEDLVAMPDPNTLLKAAKSAAKPTAIEGMMILDDDEDEEVEMMPDPQALMGDAASAAKTWAPGPGNVADRAGALPPPPPAPVEILDDDPLDVDPALAESAMNAFDIETAVLATDGLSDPFGSDNSLDGFNADFGEADAFADAMLSDDGDEGLETLEKPPVAAAAAVAQEVVQFKRPGLLWRVTHSLTIAAALVLLGAGWIFAIWKQEIREYVEGRDLDGSAMLQQIREVAIHALEGFEEKGLYWMQWIDSEVKRVADNEIRLHAIVGAQLREDLYRPVHESYLREKFGYDDTKLVEAEEYSRSLYGDAPDLAPAKPWEALYKLSAAKDVVLPLSVTYSLVRDNERSDWSLAGVKVRGYKSDLEWPEGSPKHDFGDRAYDVDSREFSKVLGDYRAASEKFVANVDALKGSVRAKAALAEQENKRRRERVIMSLSKGAFFKGVAIVGEDGASAQDVTMVITDMMENGALVKGVFSVSGDDPLSKYFVGTVDFETEVAGEERGFLSVTTVAFGDGQAPDGEASFFDAASTSRIRLKTDGFRLEGDRRDLSLRFTRSL